MVMPTGAEEEEACGDDNMFVNQEMTAEQVYRHVDKMVEEVMALPPLKQEDGHPCVRRTCPGIGIFDHHCFT